MTSRRSTHRQYTLAILAVVALLAQALVPHVHGRAGTTLASRTHHLVGSATRGETTVVPTAAAPGDSHQHAAGCPLCRAQSDARSLVLPATAVALVPGVPASLLATEVVAALATVDRNLAAPRAPPARS